MIGAKETELETLIFFLHCGYKGKGTFLKCLLENKCGIDAIQHRVTI